MEYIAVFVRDGRQFSDINLLPKQKFVRVESSEDIRGRRFSGLIEMHGWWSDRKKVIAYDALKVRNKEIFNNG